MDIQLLSKRVCQIFALYNVDIRTSSGCTCHSNVKMKKMRWPLDALSNKFGQQLDKFGTSFGLRVSENRCPMDSIMLSGELHRREHTECFSLLENVFELMEVMQKNTLLNNFSKNQR